MRSALAVAVLVIGLAAGADAEEPPRAYPGGSGCPVAPPADFPQAFTAAEEHVWDRLRRGETVRLDAPDQGR